MVEDSKSNADKCTCPACPTFNDCMKEKKETLYCARSKSACEFKNNGCICPNCPVYLENGLGHMYYCSSGKD